MQSLALLRAVHNPWQRRQMAVSTNNGLVNGPVHNLLMQFFTPDSSKMEVFETYFFDIVTTQNDHPSYVKHVLGRIYVFFTLFGYQVGGGGVSQGTGAQPAYAVFHPGQLKNGITSQRLLDQSQAGVYRGKRHIPPHFGHFGAIRVPYPKGLNC